MTCGILGSLSRTYACVQMTRNSFYFPFKVLALYILLLFILLSLFLFFVRRNKDKKGHRKGRKLFLCTLKYFIKFGCHSHKLRF